MTDYNDVLSEDREVSALPLSPHSMEAEQPALGGLPLGNATWDRIADIVNGEDLYRHEHRLTFHVIATLISENHPTDVITVQEASERNGELEATGGSNYLISLAQNTPSTANIRRYAEIACERSIIRQLAEVNTEIAHSAYNPRGRDVGQLLDEAENKVFRVAKNTAEPK